MINQVDFLEDEMVPLIGDSLKKVRALNIFIGSAWRSTGLDPFELAVFWNLISRGDERGESYPSAKTIADECKMSRARVFTALRTLQDKGFVSIEHRNDIKGSLSSNLYKVGIPQSIIQTTLVHHVDYPSLPDRQECESIEVESKEVLASKAKPASEEEVSRYCKSLDLTLNDAASIFAHWESNGYKVGRNPMKDWKATVRYWKANRCFPSQRKFHEEQPKHVQGNIHNHIPGRVR